jgi:hypothetical protein
MVKEVLDKVAKEGKEVLQPSFDLFGNIVYLGWSNVKQLVGDATDGKGLPNNNNK